MRKLSFYFITAFLVMYSGVLANASILTFDSQANYLAQVAALGYVDQQTLNFESQPAGTTIPSGGTIGGVTFTYSINSEQIAVDNFFSTTSPFNYIGLNNSDGAFVFGDSFTMTFDRGIHAVALNSSIIAPFIRNSAYVLSLTFPGSNLSTASINPIKPTLIRSSILI